MGCFFLCFFILTTSVAPTRVLSGESLFFSSFTLVGRVYFIIFLPLRWFFFIFYFINIFIYHIKVIILYMFYMPAMFYTGSGLRESKGLSQSTAALTSNCSS